MTEITAESEVNDLRKRIVTEDDVSDDEIRAAIAFMRKQRAENGRTPPKGKGNGSKSSNQQEVNLDDLL